MDGKEDWQMLEYTDTLYNVIGTNMSKELEVMENLHKL